MKILIGGGSTEHIHSYLIANPHLQDSAGWFCTPGTLYPRARYSKVLNLLGVDNGAYTHFDEKAYLRMLERLKKEGYPVQWVAAPDVVCDSRATLNLFEAWKDKIHLPKALVGQNGA